MPSWFPSGEFYDNVKRAKTASADSLNSIGDSIGVNVAGEGDGMLGSEGLSQSISSVIPTIASLDPNGPDAQNHDAWTGDAYMDGVQKPAPDEDEKTEDAWHLKAHSGEIPPGSEHHGQPVTVR